MKRFYLLEPLRGLAAFWVLLFHYPLSSATQESLPWLVTFCRHGHLGVPMFFVISGICIAAAAQSCIDKQQATSGFVKRRMRRIYPPYWFSILVVAAVPFVIELLSSLKTGTYTPPPYDAPVLGFAHYSVGDWVSVASLAKVFDWDPPVRSLQAKFTGINAVYWTLAIEVQFYLVMALALAARRWFAAVLIGITAVGAATMYMPGAFVSGLFLPYWLMFAFGIGIYYLLRAGWSSEKILGKWSLPAAAIAVGLAMAGCVALGFRSAELNQTAFAAVFAGLLYVAMGIEPQLVANAGHVQGVGRALALPLLGLGALSYSVYLLHGRLWMLAQQVARQLAPSDSIALDCLAVGITVALCIPFYWLCERPFIGGAVKAPQGKLVTLTAVEQPQVAAT